MTHILLSYCPMIGTLLSPSPATTYDFHRNLCYNISMQWKPQHPAFQQLLTALLQQHTPVYVVGGVVRDHLLGQQDKLADLDLVIDGAALPIAKRVADRLGWAFYALDEAREVARLVFTANLGEPLVCDIARIRGGSIEGDLLLRDFTMNAMAFAIERLGSATLLDICGGERDLRARLVRRVSAASLADDPARLLRAIRFAVQFNFSLEEQTMLQIKRVCSTVTLASAERIRDELWKMLATDAPAQAIEWLRQVGLLVHVLPEVEYMVGVEQSYPHYQDVYRHTLAVMQHAVQLRNWILGRPVPALGPLVELAQDSAPTTARWQQRLAPQLMALRHHFAQMPAAGHLRAEWLVWYALLHDIGKPESRTEEIQPEQQVRYRFLNHEQISADLTQVRLNALRFSRSEIALAQGVVAHHMRPHLLISSFIEEPVSRRARFRFFRDTGGRETDQAAGIDTLCLAIADYAAIHRQSPPPNWDHYLTQVDDLLTFAFAPDGLTALNRRPLVDGHTLMQQLGLAPGRQVGELLERLLEAQAAGEIATPEAALALAARLRYNPTGESSVNATHLDA